MKLFWSWQSDTDTKTGQYFVRDALKEIAELLGKDMDLAEADRPQVDHDTLGIPGTPPIVETIFQKIEDSVAFVADVTPVGQSPDGKLLPNPNVMIELGYARKACGYERIVLIANSEYLPNVEALPFDLRGSRGPTLYRLAPNASPAQRKETKRALVNALKPKVAAIVQHEMLRRSQKVVVPASSDDRKVWFQPAQPVTYVDSFNKRERPSVVFPDKAFSYMRVRPSSWPTNVRASSLLPDAGHDFPFFGSGGNGDWGRTADGALYYNFFADVGYPRVAHMITSWSSATGELWCAWSYVVEPGDPSAPSDQGEFLGGKVIKHWAQFLKWATDEIIKTGGAAPFAVDAGVEGILDSTWRTRFGELRSARDSARLRSIIKTEQPPQRLNFLTDLVNALTDNFGAARDLTPDEIIEFAPNSFQ